MLLTFVFMFIPVIISNSILDLYFKVILPSGTYALPIWGCCTNKHDFNALESIHCRVARVIFNHPRDMHSVDVRKIAKCDLLFDTYKVKIATLIYKFYNHTTPPCFEHLIQRKDSYHDFRHQHRVRTQRFETYFMKKKTLSIIQRIHCLEPFRTICCNHQRICCQVKKVSRPQKLEL